MYINIKFYYFPSYDLHISTQYQVLCMFSAVFGFNFFLSIFSYLRMILHFLVIFFRGLLTERLLDA